MGKLQVNLCGYIGLIVPKQSSNLPTLLLGLEAGLEQVPELGQGQVSRVVQVCSLEKPGRTG